MSLRCANLLRCLIVVSLSEKIALNFFSSVFQALTQTNGCFVKGHVTEGHKARSCLITKSRDSVNEPTTTTDSCPLWHRWFQCIDGFSVMAGNFLIIIRRGRDGGAVGLMR